ncbi:MAG TPA: hypothetical protein PLW81_03695 [Thiobacillaceae bacterium]|nr:hypothetical protein [Thiobacillaceae bacterium]
MTKKNSRNLGQPGRRAADRLTTRMVLASGLVNLTGAPARIFVTWGMICLLAWIVGNALLSIAKELKGASTFADIQIGLQAALSADINKECVQAAWPMACSVMLYLTIGAFVVASVALLYAYRERRLRDNMVHEMGLRIVTLEKYFDKNRATSGLTNEGKTNPEDR